MSSPPPPAVAADRRGCARVGGYAWADVGLACVGLPPAVFAALRGVAAAYIAGMVAYGQTVGAEEYFYTWWGLVLEGVVFLGLTAASVWCAAKGKRLEAGREPNGAATALAIVYQTSATAALFLDVVYWALLADGLGDFRNVNDHLLNAVIVFTDLALSATKFRFINIFFFFLYTAVYLSFAWVRRAVTDDLPYGFLNPWNDEGERKNVGITVGVYLGLLVWVGVAGALTVGFSRLKRFYSKMHLMIL